MEGKVQHHTRCFPNYLSEINSGKSVSKEYFSKNIYIYWNGNKFYFRMVCCFLNLISYIYIKILIFKLFFILIKSFKSNKILQIYILKIILNKKMQYFICLILKNKYYCFYIYIKLDFFFFNYIGDQNTL